MSGLSGSRSIRNLLFLCDREVGIVCTKDNSVFVRNVLYWGQILVQSRHQHLLQEQDLLHYQHLLQCQGLVVWKHVTLSIPGISRGK